MSLSIFSNDPVKIHQSKSLSVKFPQGRHLGQDSLLTPRSFCYATQINAGVTESLCYYWDNGLRAFMAIYSLQIRQHGGFLPAGLRATAQPTKADE